MGKARKRKAAVTGSGVEDPGTGFVFKTTPAPPVVRNRPVTLTADDIKRLRLLHKQLQGYIDRRTNLQERMVALDKLGSITETEIRRVEEGSG